MLEARGRPSGLHHPHDAKARSPSDPGPDMNSRLKPGKRLEISCGRRQQARKSRHTAQRKEALGAEAGARGFYAVLHGAGVDCVSSGGCGELSGFRERLAASLGILAICEGCRNRCRTLGAARLRRALCSGILVRQARIPVPAGGREHIALAASATVTQMPGRPVRPG
jgi:hypothetical protein